MAESILGGRYVLVAQQGSGGMSVIYRATDRVLGRTVAIKVLRPSLMTQDPTFLEKFKNEARSVANLSHPNLVTVHDVGNDDKTHYIVMEFVEGQDLKKIIKQLGAMPVERVLHLAIQICAGIGYAHRSGLVHADIKPQNILVTPQDVVKVTDFGIAQVLSDTQPQQRAEVVWGSPHYFAPEQARGEQPSPASDVYAIGIVMFEMLTGRLPYSGATQQDLALAHIRERVPRVTEYNPSVPESLVNIVYKIMSKEPNDRYRMADQLGHVLQNLQSKARDFTAQNPNVPASPSPIASPAPPMVAPPAQANPMPNLPPAVPFARPASPSSAEPTMKFSPAPSAPQPYNPRTSPPPIASATPSPLKQPQPLEQRFTAPPPRPSDSAGFVPRQYSQPMPSYEEREGVDWVTIALAVLAFVAVAGLIPLWLIALTAG